MGSLGMENGGVASLGGASALDLRIKKDPVPELPLSTIPEVPGQIDSTINQWRIKSEPFPDTQLLTVPENTEVSIENEPDIKDNDNIDSLSIEPQFDHKDAIEKLLKISMGPGFKVSDIDTEPTAALKTLEEIKKSVKEAAVSCKNGHNVILEQWQKVKIFFYIISHIDGSITLEISKRLRLLEVLKLFTNPVFKCPTEYSSIAKALIDKIEAQNGFEAPPPPPAALTIDAQSANANINKKRKSVSETPTSSKRSKDNSTSRKSPVPSPTGYSAPPASASYIWGDNGIMRGILWKQGGYVILDEKKAHLFKENAKIHGHNGLTVGDCWPRQMAALRDGAHGAPQAGIVGDKKEGAYSIVISKHYEGFDMDEGDIVYYSAPGAKESIIKEADSENSGVMILRRSMETKKPVRVLRSSNCAWKNRPAAGIRYDGLYRVTDGNVETNGKGGKFWRFTLKRLRRVDGSDQVPINLSRPTKEEVGLFEKVKGGY
ncbi:uncharacterized protein EAE97_003331 [Botrytis byssoidea]|uniref:YDG domain-containing protein n=1 Tax=Botrytis byssoidea TaxID=139641 RepID=A0A9P5IQ91_9HELO|nr:uncharacterized protein EAE97_003331 [Botrytis byssoidea]KAF7949822.1 hypothetical protein EAE97_003331 [Botrytis byssoidea]